MPEATLYSDIARRTGGDIYIGVVGPVRSGKSTFIRKFIEELVLPNIESPFDRERTKDSLPQSGSGKTVMTTEPKFIPERAVEMTPHEGAHLRVRLVDCVGYLIPGAAGQYGEDGKERQVMTPWSSSPMPFPEAAETGTKKVMTDHATLGVCVTSDGTVGELPRESYVDAEDRIFSEMKALGKPFVILLNSSDPGREESLALARGMEAKYGVPVALVSCLQLNAEDITQILSMALSQFPVKEIKVRFPAFVSALGKNHRLTSALEDAVLASVGGGCKAGELSEHLKPIREMEEVRRAMVDEIDYGTGKARISVETKDEIYYQTVSELCGLDIRDEREMVSTLKELSEIREKYSRIAPALADAERVGYGIVTPALSELRLEEPEIVRQGSGYGVRLRASGPSIHLIRAEIETELNPTVGTEQQSEELIRSLLGKFDDDPSELWNAELFGKSLHQLVNEGLSTKLDHIPEESRQKLAETLGRIVNEGSGGLICILL